MKVSYLSVLSIMVVALFAFLFWNGPHVVAGAGQNIVVLCSSCSYQGLPQRGHLVLMDSNTGDVWIYPDEAMEGRAKPVHWGKLTLGQPVARLAQ